MPRPLRLGLLCLCGILGIVIATVSWRTVASTRNQETLNEKLLAAVRECNTEEVARFLKAGANPNAFSTLKDPPTQVPVLQLVFVRGLSDNVPVSKTLSETPKIVRLLLEAGADPNPSGLFKMSFKQAIPSSFAFVCKKAQSQLQMPSMRRSALAILPLSVKCLLCDATSTPSLMCMTANSPSISPLRAQGKMRTGRKKGWRLAKCFSTKERFLIPPCQVPQRCLPSTGRHSVAILLSWSCCFSMGLMSNSATLKVLLRYTMRQ
jgi:hypothetical protein